jgi:hypothetical protein
VKDNDREKLLQIAARLRQQALQLEDLAGAGIDTPGGAPPPLSPTELARVEKLGEVAYLHWTHKQEAGSLTRGDSLSIRRRLYGDKVQGTASQFGKKGEHSLFYRDVPHGAPVHHSDPVELTEDGVRLALLWAQLHGKPTGEPGMEDGAPPA